MNTFTACAVLALVLGCATATPFAAQSRIVGGKEADTDAAPFIVSLQWQTELRRQHFCAAAIVNQDWILTAAHCIQALPVDSVIVVVAGKTDLREEDSEAHQLRYVSDYVIHENFTGGISSDDLALLKVEQPLEFNDAVQAIDMPRTKDIPVGTAKTFGWGSTSMDIIPEFPQVLHAASMELIDYQKCEEALGGAGATPLITSNLCTGPLEGGVSTCNGDSGGPLVKTNAEGHSTLIGIVSWGFYPCGGPNTPSIYVSVSSYTKWIEEKTQAAH